MSSNVFVNLGLPVLNGAGTAVDVSTLGPNKTIVINGDFPGCTIELQASQVAGGASGFAPVCSFVDGSTHKVVDVACRYLRTFVRNRVAGATFTANIDVGAPEWINTFASITMPVADGDGADIDVSALGSFWTVNVTGDLAGARVMLMISEDGTAWAPLVSFNGPGLQTFRVSAKFAHVNVIGITSAFAATCQIGAADDAAPASSSGPVSTCFVYQPGGTETGPTVFNSWVDLDAALQAARTDNGGGCYRVDVDDSITTPAVIPARVARWDLTDTVLAGAGSGAAVKFDDGCGFTGLRVLESGTFTNLNTATSPIDDIVDGDQFVIRRAVVQTQAGGVGMFRAALAGGQSATYWFVEGSTLGGTETGKVIVAANGTHRTLVMLDELSSIAVASALSCTPFGTPVLVIKAPAMIQIPTNLANWSGSGDTTPGPTLAAPASLIPFPWLGGAQGGVVSAPVHGQWLRLTSVGGNVPQVLPAISSVDFGAGGTFLFVTDASSSGINTVSIAPAGGDTIDGSASARGVPRGGGILLVSDGISRWSVVAAWGLNRLLLPYVWRQDNVAAAQAAVALSPQPTGSLFPQFTAMRNGSLVGISVRFTEIVTVNDATLTVTINGVATPLAVTLGVGSDLAITNQFAGVAGCNYIAGDRIGVTITTTGGFAPNTTDVEVIVEVEECTF